LDFLHNELRTEKYNGKVCYVFDKQIHRPEGQSFWVRGVISNATENYAITSIMRNNTMLTVVLILVAAVGGYFIVKRALVPVNTIRKTAKEISRSNDLTRRINIGRGEDEICELANTFDEMLEQIEQAFEREKQFTSDASHELRTPTAVILSECEYMTECAKTPEEFAESAASVKRQAERMSRLVSELLTISRMDKKTQAVQFEKTDISELLSFVCDEQEELHEGKIVLKRNIASGVLAEADTFLLARLFINLISNGYQYSKNDGEICVSLSENENEIIVSVQDNGIGIAEEALPKIWERFYQVDASRTQKDNGGMGLGLSIVNRIAKIHNGKVQVSSVLGSGSEFVFTMPKERK